MNARFISAASNSARNAFDAEWSSKRERYVMIRADDSTAYSPNSSRSTTGKLTVIYTYIEELLMWKRKERERKKRTSVKSSAHL